jgi:hypothetical protein
MIEGGWNNVIFNNMSRKNVDVNENENLFKIDIN